MALRFRVTESWAALCLALTLGFDAHAVDDHATERYLPRTALSSRKPVPLEDVLRQFELPSGIRFIVSRSVAQDRVDFGSFTGSDWNEAIRRGLQGYNWMSISNAQGRVSTVRITGRNGLGGGKPVTTPNQSVLSLFGYRPLDKGKRPGRYQDYPDYAYRRIWVDPRLFMGIQVGDPVRIDLPDGPHDYEVNQKVAHDQETTTIVARTRDDGMGLSDWILTSTGSDLDGWIRVNGSVYLVESDAAGVWLLDTQAAGLALAAADQPLPAGVSQDGLAGRAASVVPMAEADTITITLMVLQGQGFSGNIKNRIQNRIEIANQALALSQSHVRFRLARIVGTTYPTPADNQQTLKDLTGGKKAFRNVAALRKKTQADLVFYFRPFRPDSQGGFCGLTWINGSVGGVMDPSKGYGIVNDGYSGGFMCSLFTFAHEAGHALGAAHDRQHPSSPGIFDYAYGYGVHNLFGDIMSYFTPTAGVYATPNLNICSGQACGIPEGQPNPSDVVKTFEQTGPVVSGFGDRL